MVMVINLCRKYSRFGKSQAMKIVRTVGQAFDVCQRINEPEKKPDEGLSTTEDGGGAAGAQERLRTSSTGSSKKVTIGELPGTSGEFSEKLDKPRERLTSASSDSGGTRAVRKSSSNDPASLDIARNRTRTPSPALSFSSLKPPDLPPSPRPPDKLGTTLGGEASRSISLPESYNVVIVNAADDSLLNSSRQHQHESGATTASHLGSSTLANIPSLTGGVSGGETAQNTLASPLSLDSFIQAHSPSSPIGANNLLRTNLSISPSFAAATNPAHSHTNPFYQSAAQQLLLKSSELLSPVRPPLPLNTARAGTVDGNLLLPALSTYSSYDALNQTPVTTLGQSVEHHSVTLLRTQLEQAQQQAQVAIAQVYLLRDQLASETTARIESQLRTHQLTQSNKELIDQVQVLVTRLQNLETRLSSQAVNPTAAQISPGVQPIMQSLATPKSPERSISLQMPDSTRMNIPRLSLNPESLSGVTQLDVPSPSSARSEPVWCGKGPSPDRPSPKTLGRKRMSYDQTTTGATSTLALRSSSSGSPSDLTIPTNASVMKSLSSTSTKPYSMQSTTSSCSCPVVDSSSSVRTVCTSCQSSVADYTKNPTDFCHHQQMYYNSAPFQYVVPALMPPPPPHPLLSYSCPQHSMFSYWTYTCPHQGPTVDHRSGAFESSDGLTSADTATDGTHTTTMGSSGPCTQCLVSSYMGKTNTSGSTMTSTYASGFDFTTTKSATPQSSAPRTPMATQDGKNLQQQKLQQQPRQTISKSREAAINRRPRSIDQPWRTHQQPQKKVAGTGRGQSNRGVLNIPGKVSTPSSPSGPQPFPRVRGGPALGGRNARSSVPPNTRTSTQPGPTPQSPPVVKKQGSAGVATAAAGPLKVSARFPRSRSRSPSVIGPPVLKTTNSGGQRPRPTTHSLPTYTQSYERSLPTVEKVPASKKLARAGPSRISRLPKIVPKKVLKRSRLRPHPGLENNQCGDHVKSVTQPVIG